MRGKKEKGRANTPFQGAIGMPTAQPALSAQFRQGQQDQCQGHGHCEAQSLKPPGPGRGLNHAARGWLLSPHATQPLTGELA